MPDYPANFPAPDHTSYVGTVDQGLTRTTPPVPAPNQLVGFNSPRQEFTVTFSMVNDDYDEWREWAEEFGWDWFNLPIVSQSLPVIITSVHRVRMISDLQLVKRGDNWLSVTVSIEVIPHDPVDPLANLTRNYDIIVAGSPSVPSLDVTDAGNPTGPSTDITIAELYNYQES